MGLDAPTNSPLGSKATHWTRKVSLKLRDTSTILGEGEVDVARCPIAQILWPTSARSPKVSACTNSSPPGGVAQMGELLWHEWRHCVHLTEPGKGGGKRK